MKFSIWYISIWDHRVVPSSPPEKGAIFLLRQFLTDCDMPHAIFWISKIISKKTQEYYHPKKSSISDVLGRQARKYKF